MTILGETVITQCLGSVSIPMTLCPFQPTINSVKDLPSFFTFNGTGNYYGIAGSYESIPAFRSDASGYSFDQCALFSLNGAGIADSDLLLPDPFKYHAKITSTYQSFFPRLQYPVIIPMFSGNYGNVCLGYDGLYCSNLGIINEVSPYGGFGYNQTKITFNPSVPFNQTGQMPVSSIKSQMAIDLSNNKGIHFNSSSYAAYLFQDDYFNLNFCDTAVGSYNGKSSDPAKGTTEGDYLNILKNGTYVNVNAFETTSISYSPEVIKINPISGNFIGRFTYINGKYPSGNLWCGNVQSQGTVNPLFYISLLTLSDPSDDVLAKTTTYIQQCMGGGFLLILGRIVFYVTADLRHYVKLFLNYPQTTYVQPNIVMDGSGFIYLLRYDNIGSGFSGMYWSGGSPLQIFLQTPTLQNLNVSIDNSCYPCVPW